MAPGRGVEPRYSVLETDALPLSEPGAYNESIKSPGGAGLATLGLFCSIKLDCDRLVLGRFAYKAVVRPDLRIGTRPQLYLLFKTLTAPLFETTINTSPGRLLFSRATHVSLNPSSFPSLVKTHLDGDESPSLNHLIRALFT